MQSPSTSRSPSSPAARLAPAASAFSSWWGPALVAALLAACGGGGAPEAEAPEETGAVATASTTLQLGADALPEADAAVLAEPTFHAAPVQLAAPDDTDAADPNASATAGPRKQTVPAGMEGVPTRKLTFESLQAARAKLRADATSGKDEGTAAPAAGSSVVATYAPAQIRAAYGLPALPAKGATLTAAQAAQLGAGQTIYIVNAMHNPNVVAELAAFNQKFGLPTCATKAIATTSALPLPKAATSACEFSVVYTDPAGAMRTQAPAYESGWATEIALDVQWAHATAPLARLVLIEAPDASINSLLGAIRLANRMGPGVVSMSFGAKEGSYTAQVDSAFTGAGMSYLAATGDWGTGVYWPSVSNNVVAVGGTTLTWTGSGARAEKAWSGTGGGMSAYTTRPAYQTAAVPGLGQPLRRTLADVAFNADPSTGQYVAVMSPGSTAVNWMSVGGTSLSTPQWAGLLAVANAQRAMAARSVLGAPHGVLYGQIGAVPGTYASAFADIVQGTNGSCAICVAKAGHDSLTGLGTPQAGPLLAVLGGAPLAALAPVVAPVAIGGQVGTALTFTASASSANAVTFTLSGAPAGMVVNGNTGAVSWPVPVAGTYAVNVVAKDGKTGLSGQGTYTVTITAPKAPTVASATVSGKVGTALSYAVATTAANPVTYALAGAPVGLSINSAGLIAWPSPVAGTYAVKVTARDSKTGLTGQGVVTVQVAAAASGPVITAPPMKGVAGQALKGTIAIAAPGATSVRVTISGVPMGMTFAFSGLTLNAMWARPVTGSYSLKVTVVDSAGRSSTATVPVTIAAR
ncbi:MAG: S53 family peptidase [Rubrivivax sp.]|nr:S53 family peptidase [Rubrivivax sp.]